VTLRHARQALPYDKMVVLPTAHSAVSELPQNWSKRAQPVHAQNHVEIRQWNDIKVQDEFLGVDDEAHVLAYPVTGHLIIVGYSHSMGWPMDGKKMQMTHDFDGQKRMGGAQMNQGGGSCRVNLHGQAHGFHG
jgi:hypothetical protein